MPLSLQLRGPSNSSTGVCRRARDELELTLARLDPAPQNERFFDLPLAKKNELAYTSSKANRGYLSFGREQASLSKDPDQIGAEREAAKDQKCVFSFSSLPRHLLPCVLTHASAYRETFEIGNDVDPEYPEHLPSEEDLPGFKAVRLPAPLRFAFCACTSLTHSCYRR